MRAALAKLINTFTEASWCKSTLSQMAIASVMAYLLVSAKVAWQTGNLEGLKWAATVFGAGYLSSRKPGEEKQEEPKP